MDLNNLRKLLFHPLTVLGVALSAAALFALLSITLFSAEYHWLLVYYFAPVGIPFVAFVFDRAENYSAATRVSWALDLLVLGPALGRAIFPIPFISGHALFLVYAILSTRSAAARITAFLVMLQVVYLKVMWRDPTLIGGILLGSCAAFLYSAVRRK